MKNDNKLENKCRVCNCSIFIDSPYPDIQFNEKIFKYHVCSNCKTYNIFPTPTQSDFSKMYGEEDHSYLKNLKGKLIHDFNYPFANHQGYQINFLNEIKSKIKNKTLLDYACGSGFYMKHAQAHGAEATGIEFDEKFVALLKEKTDLNIYTLDNLLKNSEHKKFDFIHLGHVIEHLPDPHSTLEILKKFAHKETIFLIDGPLERNFCLSRIYVDLGSKLKGKKLNEFPPQHLTLTSKKSQLLFFETIGLKTEKYAVVEQYFPLPNSFNNSLIDSISFLLATVSIAISKLIPSSGNVFHYRGRIS